MIEPHSTENTPLKCTDLVYTWMYKENDNENYNEIILNFKTARRRVIQIKQLSILNIIFDTIIMLQNINALKFSDHFQSLDHSMYISNLYVHWW